VSREHTYLLPIDVIITMMQGLRKPVTLEAQVPGTGKPERLAQIVVAEQGLLACRIVRSFTGELVAEREEAFRLLQRCGALTWTLQPATQVAPLARAAEPPGAGQTPSRQVELTPAQIRALPPAQRKVFALVNGTSSLEYIAHLLAKTPEDVAAVLLELQRQRLISF
jgi:hypothetical protein